MPSKTETPVWEYLHRALDLLMPLISFLGRPNTRTFGETTRGQITGVATHELEDGAILGIAGSVAADRTGRVYTAAISPDEPVAVDWFRYARPDDPVIDAARHWLREQLVRL